MKKALAVIFSTLFAFIFQGCGQMKALTMADQKLDISEAESCQNEPVQIQEQISANQLFLNLVDPAGNVDALWSIETDSRQLLIQSSELSSSTFQFNFSRVSGCRVLVTAHYEACDSMVSQEKWIQLKSCVGFPAPPPTSTSSTTTSTTTTTVPQILNPTTTTTSTTQPNRPASRVEAPGCTPAYQNSVVNSWNRIFNFWPGYGIRRRLFVSSSAIQSFSFTTVAPAPGSMGNPGYGSFATGDFPGDGDGFLKLTISETPGCVDSSKLNPLCVSVGRLASASWSVLPGNGFSCPLEIGKVYYLNMTYGDQRTQIPGQPFCPEVECGVDFQNQIQ